MPMNIKATGDRLIYALPDIFERISLPENLEEYITQRESDPFDSNWIASYESNRASLSSLQEADQKIVKAVEDQVRETAFKWSHRAFKNSELSAYISDDFGMIFEHLLIDTDQPCWSLALLLSYLKGLLPEGHLHPATRADINRTGYRLFENQEL